MRRSKDGLVALGLLVASVGGLAGTPSVGSVPGGTQIDIRMRPVGDTSPSRQQGDPRTGAIRGRVLAADTGMPLRRVHVQLTTSGLSTADRVVATSTNTRGEFELADVAPGSYFVSASRPGYLSMQYGQTPRATRGSVVAVQVSVMRIGAVAVTMRIVRPGAVAVAMTVVRRGGVAGLRCVRFVMRAGRTAGDARPGDLEGQHGQKKQEDESFHGRGL